MAKWDWYATTVFGMSMKAVSVALVGPTEDLKPGRGRYGYTRGAVVLRGSHKLAEIWWGGNVGVHVVSTGEDGRWLAAQVREWEHEPTRVDACEDWVEAGLFDRLSVPLMAYAQGHGISINQQGDWCRGRARTVYLGSPKSCVRLVLYEKGYQCGGDESWVRLEARVKPKGSARADVARWYPGQAFAASAWLVEALKCIGWSHLQAQSVGTVWRPSDDERARAVIVKQYGAILDRWSTLVGGWQQLGMELEARCARSLPVCAGEPGTVERVHGGTVNPVHIGMETGVHFATKCTETEDA